MQHIEWDDGLATGDARVDDQHRRICALTNEFASVVHEDGDGDKTADALFVLMRYAATHVADEEALMERVGYPDLAHQRTLHAGFLRATSNLAEDFVAGRGVTAQMLLEHLVELWCDHICSEDRKIAEFIREQRAVGDEA